MKHQKNYCPRNDIYNMMIRLHARHNRTDQARGLFFEMQEWRYAFFVLFLHLMYFSCHTITNLSNNKNIKFHDVLHVSSAYVVNF